MIEIIFYQNNLGFLDHTNFISGFLKYQGSNESFIKDVYKNNYKEYNRFKEKTKSLIKYED